MAGNIQLSSRWWVIGQNLLTGAKNLVMMQDFSEDDAAADAVIETKPESTAQRTARLEREDKLRKINDEDNEDGKFTCTISLVYFLTL